MTFFAEQATAAHVRDLLRDARPADRDEWEASTEVAFGHALLEGLGTSNVARAIGLAENRQTLCLWGCTHTRVVGIGIGWMVATNAAEERFALALHTVLEGELAILDGEFHTVACFADARNTRHHQWMGWLGFRELQTIPEWGPYKLPFLYFERRRPVR